MVIKTLPQIAAAIGKLGIVPENVPDNFFFVVRLNEEDFDNLLNQVFVLQGKPKRIHRIRGFVEAEFAGIKIKIEKI